MARKKKRPHGSGSVFFNRKLKKWCGKYRDGNYPDGRPKYSTVYAATQDEAHEKLDAAIYEKKKMQPGSVGGITVGEYLTTWLTTIEKNIWHPKHITEKNKQYGWMSFHILEESKSQISRQMT